MKDRVGVRAAPISVGMIHPFEKTVETLEREKKKKKKDVDDEISLLLL